MVASTSPADEEGCLREKHTCSSVAAASQQASQGQQAVLKEAKSISVRTQHRSAADPTEGMHCPHFVAAVRARQLGQQTHGPACRTTGSQLRLAAHKIPQNPVQHTTQSSCSYSLSHRLLMDSGAHDIELQKASGTNIRPEARSPDTQAALPEQSNNCTGACLLRCRACRPTLVHSGAPLALGAGRRTSVRAVWL